MIVNRRGGFFLAGGFVYQFQGVCMSIQSIQSKKSGKSQRGYSLIELSIAMAILSVVIVGSLMGVQRILANNRANNVLQTVPRVNAALIAATAGAAGGTQVSTNLAVQLGAFEPSAVTGLAAAQTVRNDFGGQYRVTSNTDPVGTVGAKGGYFFHITNVPQSVCPVIANGLAALADGIWIGSATDFPPPAANINTLATPATGTNVKAVNGAALNVANVATACSTNTSNTVIAFIPMG